MDSQAGTVAETEDKVLDEKATEGAVVDNVGFDIAADNTEVGSIVAGCIVTGIEVGKNMPLAGRSLVPKLPCLANNHHMQDDCIGILEGRFS